jgi:hypothetical protein
LSDGQIAMLRRAIIIMTTLLVAGVALLIGRIIYLARGTPTQAASAVNANGQVAFQATLLPDVRLTLPASAEIRHTSMAGSRLAVHHGLPGGAETITILDLATGTVVSKVMVERAK